jgi:hypothetical protein
MQGIFAGKEALANVLAATISKPRLKRYMISAGDNRLAALSLYHWNTELSRAMYLPIQIWEVALRNRLNTFLERRYGADWPYDDKVAVRQLTDPDKEKILSARYRQQKKRRLKYAPTSAIVADLSAGFWVSLLSDSYEIPYGWKTAIGRVFAYDAALDRSTAHGLCVRMLDIRNRIAHHEAIYEMPLTDYRADAERLVKAMCQGSHLYLAGKCELAAAIAKKPGV